MYDQWLELGLRSVVGIGKPKKKTYRLHSDPENETTINRGIFTTHKGGMQINIIFKNIYYPRGHNILNNHCYSTLKYFSINDGI